MLNRALLNNVSTAALLKMLLYHTLCKDHMVRNSNVVWWVIYFLLMDTHYLFQTVLRVCGGMYSHLMEVTRSNDCSAEMHKRISNHVTEPEAPIALSQYPRLWCTTIKITFLSGFIFWLISPSFTPPKK